MKHKLILDEIQKVYALVFDKNDEFIDGLTQFAREANLTASHFTGIGAFRAATLGYLDVHRKEYKRIPVFEQTEVLSLVGDITISEGRPNVHAHVVLGLPDGTTRGGHILQATVWPTLEVVVEDTPSHLRRKFDPEAGIALISLEPEPVEAGR